MTRQDGASNLKVRPFRASDTRYETFRQAGSGYQNICQWVGPEDGAPYQAGIAELSRIRITDYVFGFDDFLHVLEGGINIYQNGEKTSLGPGDALYIPKGATVTLEVPDRLLWTYVAHTDDTHWKDSATEPRSVEEM